MLTYCEVDVSELNTVSVEGPTMNEPDGVRVLVQPRGWETMPGALPLTVWNLDNWQARWLGHALLNASYRNVEVGI